MSVYLRAKFEVSSIITLTSFRQGGAPPGNVTRPPRHTSKRTPKKPTQIKVKEFRTLKMTDIPNKSDVLTLSWPFWQGIPTLKVKPPNSIFITTNV